MSKTSRQSSQNKEKLIDSTSPGKDSGKGSIKSSKKDSIKSSKGKDSKKKSSIGGPK